MSIDDQNFGRYAKMSEFLQRMIFPASQPSSAHVSPELVVILSKQATSNVHQQFHSRKSTLITCVTSLIDLKNSPSSLIGQPRRKQSDDLQ